jgi:hypothetical protein
LLRAGFTGEIIAVEDKVWGDAEEEEHADTIEDEIEMSVIRMLDRWCIRLKLAM